MVDLTDEVDIETRPSPYTSANDIVAISQPAALERKRSTPDDAEAESLTQPTSKRKRADESSLMISDTMTAVVSRVSTFDDAVHKLLQRSCTLVLDHIGFDGASPEALEALCSEVDAYLTKLLSYVTESMLAARRSQSTPLDFEFAMRRAGLTSRLLKPHLKTPVSFSKTQLRYPPADPEEQIPTTMATLLGKDLSGASEMLGKSYIPKHLPTFPSKHTFKSTDIMTQRENDPRKIREKATEAARHGEEALRRLVKVGKSSDPKGAKMAGSNDERRRQRHKLWEKMMEELAHGKAQSGSIGAAAYGPEEHRIAVDASKQYWRKPTTRSNAVSGMTGNKFSER